jgi:hypothetical protein
MQLERRGDLAHGRAGPLQSGLLGLPCLPAQVKSAKSQGVRGTESPDSSDQTLKKTEQHVSVFLGHYLNIEVSSLQVCRSSTHRQFNLLSAAGLGQRA